MVSGAGLFTATQALSQALAVYGGIALVWAQEPKEAGSDDALAFESYVEFYANGFYAGVWASIVN